MLPLAQGLSASLTLLDVRTDAHIQAKCSPLSVNYSCSPFVRSTLLAKWWAIVTFPRMQSLLLDQVWTFLLESNTNALPQYHLPRGALLLLKGASFVAHLRVWVLFAHPIVRVLFTCILTRWSDQFDQGLDSYWDWEGFMCLEAELPYDPAKLIHGWILMEIYALVYMLEN